MTPCIVKLWENYAKIIDNNPKKISKIFENYLNIFWKFFWKSVPPPRKKSWLRPWIYQHNDVNTTKGHRLLRIEIEGKLSWQKKISKNLQSFCRSFISPPNFRLRSNLVIIGGFRGGPPPHPRSRKNFGRKLLLFSRGQ